MVAAAFALTLFLVSPRVTESFSLFGRVRPASLSSNNLWQTKSVTFRSSNGTIVMPIKFTSNINLTQFYEDNDVAVLIHDATNQTSVRPNLTALIQGANYTFLTAAENLLLSAALAKSRVQEVAAKVMEPSPGQSQLKAISYLDATSKTQRVKLGSRATFREFLEQNQAACLVDSDGFNIIGFDDIIDGAAYTLGGLLTLPTDQATTLQREFDYNQLPLPSSIRPLNLTRDKYPGKYICPSGYRQSVLSTIYNNLAASDDSAWRVPPLALVGCSRSGKTATLEELASEIAQDSTARAIFITFNDYMPLSAWEHDNPLQAVLTRIVFGVLKSGTKGSLETYDEEFDAFKNLRYEFDPSRIQSWLSKTPAVLLMDELNNLLPLAKTTYAQDLGDFLRRCFLLRKGRYLVFTSHALDTMPSFGHIIDSSSASSRKVVIQRLPRVDSLLDVLEYLNPDINGATEAMFYGLLPGLIYDQKWGRGPNAKQAVAGERFNRRRMRSKEREFVRICTSFITGDINQVPYELRIVLTVRPLDPGERSDASDDALIGWVPFILQDVLRRTTLREDHWLSDAKDQLAWMCRRLGDAVQGSGKRYEFLFAICYLVRCLSRRSYGDMLPVQWVQNRNIEVKVNPFSAIAAGKVFDMCKTWSDMVKGIDVESQRKTIALFIPSHAKFESYDIIAVLVEGNAVVDCRGFQLKEASHNQRRPKDIDDIERRFLCKGLPPQETFVDQNGWTVPKGTELDAFYGESGRYWTPEQWRRLNDSFEEALRLRERRGKM